MRTRPKSCFALLGIALGLTFSPVSSGKLQAQPVDLNAAAEAKADAGREARSGGA